MRQLDWDTESEKLIMRDWDWEIDTETQDSQDWDWKTGYCKIKTLRLVTMTKHLKIYEWKIDMKILSDWDYEIETYIWILT